MSTPTQTPLAGVVEYPGSDGQPSDCGLIGWPSA
jgi:hypothetical protein